MSQGNWHVNPTTGNPGRCSVDWSNPRSRGCPHGLSEHSHYATAAEAVESYAATQETELLPTTATLEEPSQSLEEYLQGSEQAANSPGSATVADVTAPQYLSKSVGERSFWGRNGKKIGAAVVATFTLATVTSLLSSSKEPDGAGPQGASSVTAEQLQEDTEVEEQPNAVKSESSSDAESLSQEADGSEFEELPAPVSKKPSAKSQEKPQDPNTSSAAVPESAHDWGEKTGEKLRETGQKLRDQVTPERVDKLKEAGSKTKEYLQGVLEGTGVDPSQWSAKDYSDFAQPGEASGSVLFQGKKLVPTKAEVAKAEAQLKSLKVAPAKTSAPYDRATQFGRSFQTGVVGRTEHRDVTDGIFKNSAPQSRAIGGSFVDPYTGEEVKVVKGSAHDTNVDHVVPLHEVVLSEDSQSPLNHEERLAIANDPANLQIVGASINKSKGDKDPGKWLPPYEPSHLRYVIATINVKSKYGLTVDRQEHKVLEQVLASRQ